MKKKKIDEFEQQADKILESVDPCFRNFIESVAWASDPCQLDSKTTLEDVIPYMKQWAERLKPCLEKFKESVIVKFLASRETSK